MHPILEMETAGIAQVAAENGIPLLSIRAISDGPRAPIPFNLGEMMDEDANLRAGRTADGDGSPSEDDSSNWRNDAKYQDRGGQRCRALIRHWKLDLDPTFNRMNNAPQARDCLIDDVLKHGHQHGHEGVKEYDLGDADIQVAFDDLFKCPRG